MIFREKSLQARTSYFVLAALVWMVIGGPSWAQEKAAKDNPGAFLARLAEDRRLALTPEQREALRAAARRPDADEIFARLAGDPRLSLTPEQRGLLERQSSAMRQAVKPLPAIPPSPARAMATLGAELGALASAAAGPTKDRIDVAAAAAAALERFDAAHAEVLTEFTATERALRRAGLSPEVLARHTAVVAGYRQQAAAVRDDLEAACAGDLSTLASAAEALATSTEERDHRAYDPARLPYAVVQPSWREPGQPLDAPAAEAKASTGPAVRSAAELEAPSFVQAKSQTPPSPDDLAETPDVQITSEIRDLAASLGHKPLRIYDWVRNNVEFYPTWGSVQGSQRTLEMGRGNAADIASLLIALLRAAGVPARYTTGTVEIPADQAQNWLGGAETPQVAQQILGQGGVANVGLLDASGVLTAIRIEHVWAQAWIDNVPSRGAVNREGDTWLPLDAAFKQHAFTPASDVFTAVPFDTVFDPSNPPFSVDESLGKVTDIDLDQLDAAFEQWVQDADDYIIDNGVEQSFESILGGQQIVSVTSTVFAGALPYRVVERAAPVSELPSELRHAVRLRGFNTEFDRILGSATFDVQLSLPELDAHRLNLRFPPATQADADVLDAARQNGATSLPVYLIDVVPVVELDGVEIARGSALGMGGDFFLDVALIEPGRSETIPYQVIAGDEIIVGITGNGINQGVVEKRFDGFPVEDAPEYLHQVQLHYWAETDYLGEVAASRRGVHTLRLPSVGLFSSNLSVSYLFGAPRTAVYAGRSMDVQRSLVGAAGADPDQVVGWVKQSGLQGSYLEGSVFEQLELIASGTPQPNGISSVHLISHAASQGVPIYRRRGTAAAQPARGRRERHRQRPRQWPDGARARDRDRPRLLDRRRIHPAGRGDGRRRLPHLGRPRRGSHCRLPARAEAGLPLLVLPLVHRVAHHLARPVGPGVGSRRRHRRCGRPSFPHYLAWPGPNHCATADGLTQRSCQPKNVPSTCWCLVDPGRRDPWSTARPP